MSVGSYFHTTLTVYGGAIDTTPIGATDPSTAAFTTLDADLATTLDQTTIDTTDGVFSVVGSNNVDFDVTAAISLDSDAASNFTTSVGDLTVSAAGSAILTSQEATADAIFINASDTAAGIDINFGTAGLDAASGVGATETASGGFTFTSSAGGASGGGGAGGDAGDFSFIGGTGGAGDGSNASGDGASFSLTAGAAGADGGGGAGAGGTGDIQSVGNLTLDSSAGSIGVGTDADTGAINIGTSATARTIAIGSTTSTTVTVDASGDVSIDSASGAGNFTVGGGDLTLSATGSSILSSSEASVDAIRIVASDASGGVDIDFGDNGWDARSSTGATGVVSGAFTFVTGTGGAGSGADAPGSGAISLTTGTGAAAVASFDGGDGGTITITGGDGGAGTAGVDGGDGADISIQPGAGGVAGSGVAGAVGTVNISTTVSGGAVNIGHSTSEVTIGDNLTVTGDLTVNGDTTTVSTSTVLIEDPILALATTNTTSDTVDIGFYGTYDDGGGDKYAGIVRDASNGGCFTFFEATATEPTTTADVSTLANICVGTITANNIIESCEHLSVAGGGSLSPSPAVAVTFMTTTGAGDATGTLADGTVDCQSHNILAADVASTRKYVLTVTNFRDATGSSVQNKLEFKVTGQSAHLIWNDTDGFWMIREAGVKVTS